jgi:hypothetical protein
MTKPEAKINKRLSDALKMLSGVEGERIENMIGSGRPDWNLYIEGGKTVFVESKFMYDKVNQLKEWTAIQRRWARDRIRQGFKVFVLIGNEETTYLIDAAIHLKHQCIKGHDGKWGKSINPKDLAKLL